MSTFDERPEKNTPVTDGDPDQAAKPKKSKKKLIITLVVVILAVITVASVGVAALLAWRPYDEPESVQPSAETETNIEDMIDKTAPSKNTQYFLICGCDLSEELTDVIMVVCYQYDQNRATILQIPRDTVVSREYSDETTKINSVYHCTPEGMRRIDFVKECINDQFGITIDHYVLFTIDGFASMIDTLGGIDMENPSELVVEDRANGGEMVLPEGLIHLDGNAAEGFVRHRRSYIQGDIGRLQAQRVFYTAFAQKVLNMSLFQTVTLGTQIYGDVMTDMSIGEMLKYASHMKGIDMNTIEICILPGQDVENNGLSCWTIHTDRYVELYNSMLNPEGEPLTADSVNAPQLKNSYDFTGEGTTLGKIAGLEQPEEMSEPDESTAPAE